MWQLIRNSKVMEYSKCSQFSFNIWMHTLKTYNKRNHIKYNAYVGVHWKRYQEKTYLFAIWFEVNYKLNISPHTYSLFLRFFSIFVLFPQNSKFCILKNNPNWDRCQFKEESFVKILSIGDSRRSFYFRVKFHYFYLLYIVELLEKLMWLHFCIQ